MVEGREGSFLLTGHALAPEPFPAPAHVPVAQLVHEGGQLPGTLRDPVIRQVVVHLGDQGVQLRQDPPVHQRQLGLLQRMRQRVKSVDLRVHREECVGILQRRQEFPLAFLHRFLAEAAGQPRG